MAKLSPDVTQFLQKENALQFINEATLTLTLRSVEELKEEESAKEGRTDEDDEIA